MTGSTMGDDTDDKQKGEAGRETFETVPPELRPFYAPRPDRSIDVSKNPRLADALATLRVLDEIEAEEREEAAAKGGPKAHVARVEVPNAAQPAAEPTAARVEVAVPVLILPENKPLAERQVVLRKKPGDPAANPWTKPADDVRASALPSSLRPRALEGDAPLSEQPAGVPKPPKRRTLIAAAVAGVGVLLFGFVLFRGPKQPLVQGAPPATGQATAVSSAPAVESARPVAIATPATSVEPAKSADPVKSAEPAPTIAPPKPKAPRVADDPYDAAPMPTVTPTAAPTVTEVPQTPVAPSAPAPKAPVPVPTSGRILGGEE